VSRIAIDTFIKLVFCYNNNIIHFHTYDIILTVKNQVLRGI